MQITRPSGAFRRSRSTSARRSARTSVVAVLLYCAASIAACGSSDSDASVSPPGDQVAPLAFAAGWTYGDALCGAASADGALFVAAEGASIAVLDGPSLARGTPLVLARAETEVAPAALVCDPPYVFVAGGTAGVWRVTIGDGDSIGTVGGRWREQALVLESDGAPFLDVALVEGGRSGPLLAAITSARAGFGASELAVVDRAPPHALRARVSLIPTRATPGAKAFALAADPFDPAIVYVAMGSAGIWRVDLSDPERPLVVRGPIFDLPDERLDGEPAAARDVACARAGDRTLLFAAIERGGLAQVDVTDPGSFGPHAPTSRALLECDPSCGPIGTPFGFRVAAAGREDGTVLVALATNSVSAERREGGPYSPVGRWEFDLLLPEPPDAPIGCRPRTFVLRGRPPASPGDPTPRAVVVGAACRVADARSIDLVLGARGPTLFEQRFDGSAAFALTETAWEEPSLDVRSFAAPYAGSGLASTDGTASAIDPGFLYFGTDGISLRPAGVPRFDTSSEQIAILEGTASLCPSATQFCNAPELAVGVPTPWANGISGGARWTDPADPGHEWFAAGKSRVSRQCAADPCAWDGDWCLDPWREEGNAPLDDQRPPGWEIVELDAGLDLRFWSIASPPDDLGRVGRNYFGSVSGPPASSGEPGLLHLFRGAIREGYVVCSAADVVDLALAQCASCRPCRDARGRGQRVEPSWSHTLTTHFELDRGDDPASALTWRGEPFSLVVDGLRRDYLAIATGWVVPVEREPWSEHANRASIVVYDVTDVGPRAAPALVRILLGPRGVPGDAVAVRAARIGSRTWLFAGDLAGGAHAFDVSVGSLVDGAPLDATDPATALEPAASWYGPLDAYDGERANVTDLEIDFDTDPARPVLVLGNGRRGIAVLDVDASAGIALVEADRSPIDTPGVVSGLVPIEANGKRWFAVGDARCGVRVYRRER